MLQLTRQDRFSLPFMAVLTAILLTMSGVPARANSLAAMPNRDLTPSALAGAVSPQGLLNPDGTLDMSTGFQGTLDLRGWEVILDGERGPVLKPASRPAASQVTAWNALPNQGLSGGYLPMPSVHALAVVGSDLYVGGNFTRTGDGALTNLGRIARYDTTAGTWNPLPNQGLNNDVSALAVVGSDLYVGGHFTQTGDALTNLGRIARYDTTAGTWNPLPNQGLNNDVRALAVSGSDLYVGGAFTQTGDGALTNLGYIARGGAYDNVYLPLYLPFVTRNWTPTPTPTPCPQFRAGTWHGFADFTVPSDRSRVENFTVDWYTGNCGTWHINEPELPINNCRIEFETSGGGAIRLSIGGTFTSEEEMQGSAFVLTSQCLASGTWWSWWVSGTE